MSNFFQRARVRFWKLLYLAFFLTSLAAVWFQFPIWEDWQSIWFLYYRLAELIFQLSASLYLCTIFLLKGTSGAPEARSRLATFYVAVVIFVVVGLTGLNLRVWPDAGADLLLAASNCAFRQNIVWGFLPLLACYAVHSAAHCVRELHRLDACWRNALARGMVAIILCTGFVAMVIVFRLAQADGNNEMAEIVEASQYYRIETDQTTARWAAECPDNYQIQIMRASWLQDHGRPDEADAICRQVRTNTNLPAHVRSWLDAELARQQGTNAATLRPAGDFGVQ